MQSLFRISILFCLMLGFSTLKSSAQMSCSLKYRYDAAGNRIKREYTCPSQSPENPETPVPWGDPILSTVYPNPTTGLITGTFTSPVPAAGISISTMGGILVLQQNYSQTLSSFTVNIAQAVPGNYLLTVSALNRVESYIITKL